MSSTIAEIEEEAERRIEALDASAHQLQGVTTHQWRAAETDLTEDASAINQHLIFSASVEDAPATGQATHDATGSVQVTASLEVMFLYKLPAGGQKEAKRKAATAAGDVVRALMQYWPGVAVEVVNAYTPGERVDDVMPVQVLLDATFDLAYSPLP